MTLTITFKVNIKVTYFFQNHLHEWHWRSSSRLLSYFFHKDCSCQLHLGNRMYACPPSTNIYWPREEFCIGTVWSSKISLAAYRILHKLPLHNLQGTPWSGAQQYHGPSQKIHFIKNLVLHGATTSVHPQGESEKIRRANPQFCSSQPL